MALCLTVAAAPRPVGRWAVKEATFKALGTRVLFPDIEVVSAMSDSGDRRPRLVLHGSADAIATRLAVTVSRRVGRRVPWLARAQDRPPGVSADATMHVLSAM